MTQVSSDIVAAYRHAQVELAKAERRLAKVRASRAKYPISKAGAKARIREARKFLAARNDVAAWGHVVREMRKRYQFLEDAA